MAHNTSRILGLGLAAFLCTCDPKPSLQTCQRYYEAIRQASRGGPRVLERIVSSSSAKASAIDFCLAQPRHQIECALSASSFAELGECESQPKRGIRDSLPDFSDLDSFADFGDEN